VVPDAATNAFIAKLADGLQLWLGATEEKVEGLWVWVDGTKMDFKAWNLGEPSNSHKHEHYLITGQNSGWNDAPVKEKVIVGYICEWKDPAK